MIFHSLEFLTFFVSTVTVYWMLPHRWQNVLLLVASYVFYGWVHPWFLALIFATTFIDFWSALGMERWPEHRRRFLWLSIVTNFGLLGSFKYFNFFVDNVAATAALVGWHVSPPVLNILLPIGISFYTFQSMSYTVDVYWGHLKARRSFLEMAVFVSFWPHLVAGPIMRASNLLPQVEGERRFSAPAARDATLLIAWGLFKKLVIADNVGVIANKVFALKAPDFYLLWAGVFAFCIQIYADFSAYTDIARGSARWLGFELTSNFDHPYLATGPTEFWRRWNISLTTWFRDYVFLPMSYALSRRLDDVRWLGLRGDVWIYAIATQVTFLLSGLWHGANWNYVIWGGYHGLLLVVARVMSPRRKRRRGRGGRWLAPLQGVGMFALTCVGWLIFRETNLSMLARDLVLSPFASTPLQKQAGVYLFVLALLYSMPLWIQSAWAALGAPDLTAALIPTRDVHGKPLPATSPAPDEAAPRWPAVVSQGCLCGLLFAVVLILRSRASLDFIYFQF
jgi:alginate O-acetyltransferase complex protein AlgI